MTNFADAFLGARDRAIDRTQHQQDRAKASWTEQMMGRAYAAPEEQRAPLLNELGTRAPLAAMQFEGHLEQRQERAQHALVNQARWLKAMPEQHRPAGWLRLRDKAAQALGIPELAQMDYSPEFEPVLDQFIAMGSGNQGAPAGFQELHMKAVAAGYQPGTPEYERAIRVNLGTEGRASSAGMGFDTFTDAAGNPRPQRNNPRSGSVEIWLDEEGRWVPLGNSAPRPSVQGPVPAMAATDGNGAPSDFNEIPIQVRARAQQLADAGLPFHIVNGQLIEGESAGLRPTGGGQMPSSAPTLDRVPINEYGGGPTGGLGVGRRKEDEAAAVKLAEGRANLQLAPEQAEADAARAAQIAAAEAEQKRQQDAIAALPQVEVKANATLSLIDQALNHPGRATATGGTGMVDPRNYLPGTNATDFRVLLDQLKGQTFLEAFQMLKGGGAITQVEGVKAEQAIARLNSAQSDEAFVQALKELREVAASAITRARERAQGGQPAGQVPMPSRAGDVVDNSNPLANYGF